MDTNTGSSSSSGNSSKSGSSGCSPSTVQGQEGEDEDEEEGHEKEEQDMTEKWLDDEVERLMEAYSRYASNGVIVFLERIKAEQQLRKTPFMVRRMFIFITSSCLILLPVCCLSLHFILSIIVIISLAFHGTFRILSLSNCVLFIAVSI